jgi:hypothetical protein
VALVERDGATTVRGCRGWDLVAAILSTKRRFRRILVRALGPN